MEVNRKIQLVEVCPRDGFQNLDKVIDTNTKVEFVNLLSDSGLKKIEVSGFVHPRTIPQLADAEDVFKKINRKEGVIYRGLVPNEYGAYRAVNCGVNEMLALICCSETYNQKNQNMTIEQSLVQIKKILSVANTASIPVTVALALAFFCPYEGIISKSRVLEIIEKIVDMGVCNFYLATSSGMEDPRHVSELLTSIKDRWPHLEIGLHLHNRNGMALANVLSALNAGVTTFEGSILGLGGGIKMAGNHRILGNVPQEDLIHLFNLIEMDCGINIDSFTKTVKKAERLLGYQSSSFVIAGGTRSEVVDLTRLKFS